MRILLFYFICFKCVKSIEEFLFFCVVKDLKFFMKGYLGSLFFLLLSIVYFVLIFLVYGFDVVDLIFCYVDLMLYMGYLLDVVV